MSHISIRTANLSDTAQILEIYSYYVTDTAVTFEYDVPSEAEFSKRIETVLAKYPYIVAEKNGKILGYAYAREFVGRKAYEWSAELTVYVDRNCLKQGIGKMLYSELERILRSMGITNVYACIAVPEKEDKYLTRNSLDFHEHMGFRNAGEFYKCGYKFNCWYNMVWAEKIIGVHSENQQSIRFFNNLNKE